MDLGGDLGGDGARSSSAASSASMYKYSPSLRCRLPPLPPAATGGPCVQCGSGMQELEVRG